MRILSIQITAECDLRCPWCIENDCLRETSGVITKQAFERLMLHIKAVPYDTYSFQGGEALLYTNETFQLMDAIKKEQPNTHLHLNTNATHLTEETTIKLKDRDTSVTVSLEAEGYKGIKHLISNALEPEKVIANINAVNHLMIRSVITDTNNFANNLLTLHALFPRATIDGVLDLNKLHTLTDTDINNIKKEYAYMKSRTKTTDWLSFCRTFNGRCSLEFHKYLFLTGEIKDSCPLCKKEKDGCTEYIEGMGRSLYEKYRQAVKEAVQ